MRLLLGLNLIILSLTIQAEEIHSLPDFFVKNTILDQENYFLSLGQDEINMQKKRYVGEDQPIEEHSFFRNDFLQTDSFRFYNNTQYSFDEVQNKYINAQLDQISLVDLSISLGYGMEFMISKNYRIGYEYLSSFPHDRGQSIRIFWKVSF